MDDSLLKDGDIFAKLSNEGYIVTKEQMEKFMRNLPELTEKDIANATKKLSEMMNEMESKLKAKTK